MDKIKLNDIRIFARHGCLDEEGLTGSMYRVDVCVSADLTRAAHTDSIEYAPDYSLINSIVHEEMAVRSLLLEHVAGRIIDRIMQQFPEVQKAEVSVSKINPPVPGNIASVSVILKRKRKKRKS